MTKDDLEAQHDVLIQSREHFNDANHERVAGAQHVIALDDHIEEEKENVKDNHHKIEEKLSTQENYKSMLDQRG